MSGKHILVAEDDSALAAIIKFNLTGAGFTVTTAANGHEAWELAQSTHFDMVVTDHRMPEMTGIELCERLRANEGYANTPIVLITGERLGLDLWYLTDELGIIATFEKPFSPKEVVEAVEGCFGAIVC